ncbi:PLP-dependent transferase [Pseudovirgaria hyperparasitica]|uniref:PLP-dependent transferase n=1 Tax=Pseudovirgaria hyperparasitica TaxID=470096 RepID=A0A6A6WDM7_9PEZI|nr:PLP-dependent transferase [Pseudovirgaria hyperparasitica]KAF2760813.1 PLP-dependent transferase [Pseudovirgaria hyperparasitica]
MQSLRSFPNVQSLIDRLLDSAVPGEVLPSQQTLAEARNQLFKTLPSNGIGLESTIEHLTRYIKPALNGNSLTANYYGFVTGGSTAAASLADNLATLYDQNVQVHLPNETIATDLEDAALRMLCSLLSLNAEEWPHRTFTTGATASNVIGLACAREAVISKHLTAKGAYSVSCVGETGLVKAMREAGVEDIQVLTSAPHSSLSKAASILGLGRSCIKLIGHENAPHLIDLAKLESALQEPNVASIVAISCSEVNTGKFATHSESHMREIRHLCDRFNAWVHVDGAFGIFARLLTDADDASLIQASSGIELADSITGDGHKLLNVPYDCGFILTRSRSNAEQVFQNPNAAYLSGGAASDIASPLNIGIENSRRFRALPVYATLVAYGRHGYAEMLERQVRLSRGIAKYITESAHFELLPERTVKEGIKDSFDDVFIIVLFRARDASLNDRLVDLIKATAKIYVSGTAWKGLPACRFAVSNWAVEPERDLQLITSVLEGIVHDWKSRTAA